ncbi:unnamed protein product [Prunus brigantina]
MATRNGDPNPEVFVGPRSWNQIEGFAGPKDYPSIRQTSCGPVSIINPQARIEESEVSPPVDCLSICCLGKYPLTLHQKARLYGTTVLSNPPSVKNIWPHETNQQPGHCGVRIEEQEGNLTKMKHHADRDLPTTHDIPRPEADVAEEEGLAMSEVVHLSWLRQTFRRCESMRDPWLWDCCPGMNAMSRMGSLGSQEVAAGLQQPQGHNESNHLELSGVEATQDNSSSH